MNGNGRVYPRNVLMREVENYQKLVKERRRPAVRFDCGFDDHQVEPNRRLHAHLEKLHFAHEYAEHPGVHEWAYWDEHIQETLAFVMKRLAAK